jgi:hypothetical protein
MAEGWSTSSSSSLDDAHQESLYSDRRAVSAAPITGLAEGQRLQHPKQVVVSDAPCSEAKIA